MYYLATRPDGTVPPTAGHANEYPNKAADLIPTVNIADHIGETVDHPTPGRP
ncbi:hypothetical protein [Streptomyces sp. NPDC102437]|uniref:hypothetical protein n=1 Tax=Streptomyces sp. NPDC102437 TaxID=3366175 RepID=UPI00382B3DCC